jgi:hypothetical protein
MIIFGGIYSTVYVFNRDFRINRGDRLMVLNTDKKDEKILTLNGKNWPWE